MDTDVVEETPPSDYAATARAKAAMTAFEKAMRDFADGTAKCRSSSPRRPLGGARGQRPVRGATPAAAVHRHQRDGRTRQLLRRVARTRGRRRRTPRGGYIPPRPRWRRSFRASGRFRSRSTLCGCQPQSPQQPTACATSETIRHARSRSDVRALARLGHNVSEWTPARGVAFTALVGDAEPAPDLLEADMRALDANTPSAALFTALYGHAKRALAFSDPQQQRTTAKPQEHPSAEQHDGSGDGTDRAEHPPTATGGAAHVPGDAAAQAAAAQAQADAAAQAKAQADDQAQAAAAAQAQADAEAQTQANAAAQAKADAAAKAAADAQAKAQAAADALARAEREAQAQAAAAAKAAADAGGTSPTAQTLAAKERRWEAERAQLQRDLDAARRLAATVPIDVEHEAITAAATTLAQADARAAALRPMPLLPDLPPDSDAPEQGATPSVTASVIGTLMSKVLTRRTAEGIVPAHPPSDSRVAHYDQLCRLRAAAPPALPEEEPQTDRDGAGHTAYLPFMTAEGINLRDVLLVHLGILDRLGHRDPETRLFGWISDPRRDIQGASIMARLIDSSRDHLAYYEALDRRGLVLPRLLKRRTHGLRRGGICAIRDHARERGYGSYDLECLLMIYGRWRDPRSVKVYLVEAIPTLVSIIAGHTQTADDVDAHIWQTCRDYAVAHGKATPSLAEHPLLKEQPEQRRLARH
ncbi:hypothetical protein RI054_06g33700 [Pseudoscourfieldia marina]